jgi:F-type H+/Na+-transporting ATPase subunit alpha
VQASILWTLQKGYFDSIEVKSIVTALNSLRDFLTTRKDALLTTIRNKAALAPEIEAELKAAADEWKATFATK